MHKHRHGNQVQCRFPYSDRSIMRDIILLHICMSVYPYTFLTARKCGPCEELMRLDCSKSDHNAFVTMPCIYWADATGTC